VNASLFVRDMRAEDAISLLLNAHQLEKKVLNENTILVYPDRPEKEKEYASLIVRSFYLSNADPAQVVALVKQVASPKLIHADARLNMVVVRDTPRAMEAIERLILAQDLPQSELLLEVEVLEVNSSDVLDLGLRYPPTIGFTPFSRPAGSTADLSYAANGQLTLADLSNLNKGSVLVSVGSPALSLNANQSRNHSKVLANPRIRVKNREKATITIGDRVPVITTTTNNGVTSENVNYLDVGLTLRVEPNLSLEDEIGIKVSLEVSNVVKTITTKNGLVAYQLGQRKADTVLTARDGETQVLAGLLSRNDGEESNAIPGIGSLPLLDRVFGSRKDVQSKTEVILLVTPRVVRNLALPPPHVMTFHSGTEARIGLKPPAAHAGKDAGGETAK
jgi:general secretion pathway protein D